MRKSILLFEFIMLVSLALSGNQEQEMKHKPQFTRGLYINAYRAGDREYMERVINDFGGLINTMVIDIKDTHGNLTYGSSLDIVKKVGAQGTLIKDIRSYVTFLKENGYYLIGRIVVFRDSEFARYKNCKYGVRVKGTRRLWRDENGFVWVDPFCEDAWKYNLDIAEEAAKAGFDEIQFDYLRFPSMNGNTDAYFPYKKKGMKEDAILAFLSQAEKRLQRYGVRTSIALFGYAAWYNHLPREGQHFYEMGKRVSIVYPMLYPSHFADNFLFSGQKEKRTYDIVFKSIKRGDSLLRYTDCKLVAYIQGFDWKRSKLGKDYIRIQMQAAEDAGSDGWVVWNAKGEYKDTYHSLVNKVIKVHIPNEVPRIHELSRRPVNNESQSEKYDNRGIEAILCW